MQQLTRIHDKRVWECYMQAQHELKQIGFVVDFVSEKVEATYMHLPETPAMVLRVSTVGSRNKNHWHKTIIARLTFSEDKVPHNKDMFNEMMYRAVGRYFIASRKL